MFDIGFWEMVVVGVVALLVIGPRELPALLRGLSRWMARAREVAGEFRAEFTREVERAEELKRLVEQESEIAELHRTLEEARKTVPIDGGRSSADRAGADAGDDAGRAAPGASHRVGRETPGAAPGVGEGAAADTPQGARSAGDKADGASR